MDRAINGVLGEPIKDRLQEAREPPGGWLEGLEPPAKPL
jgi:hypothetical protein